MVERSIPDFLQTSCASRIFIVVDDMNETLIVGLVKTREIIEGSKYKICQKFMKMISY